MFTVMAMVLALQERGGKIEWRSDFVEGRVSMVYFTDDN